MIAAPQSRRVGKLHSRPGENWRSQGAGWLFCAPAIILLVVFLIIPIGLAAWVSLSNWGGIGSPLASGNHFVGLTQYKALIIEKGLPQQQFGESIRNTFYFVLLVVPTQTLAALVLAVVVSRKGLFARGFFRTVYYFPSVTSSVAIAIMFQFLFSGSGTINSILRYLGVHGPSWLTDPSGLIHLMLGGLGVHNGPGALVNHGLLGVSWWDWLAGPSVAMVVLIILAVWTTTGTFMLIFLPALYNISAEVEEAALVDGANAWRQFWKITVPLVRPTMFLVVTLGLIGTWSVFDSVFLITNGGQPEGTTLTPTYLAYSTSFNDFAYAQGAAIAFLLFAIIILVVLANRWFMRRREVRAERAERREMATIAARRAAAAAAAAASLPAGSES